MTAHRKVEGLVEVVQKLRLGRLADPGLLLRKPAAGLKGKIREIEDRVAARRQFMHVLEQGVRRARCGPCNTG